MNRESSLPFVSFDCRHRYRSGFELSASFDVNESVAAIVGTSGSGKTTILSAIAGLLRPQHGTIRLQGRLLFDSEGIVLPPEKRNVGLLLQDDSLFPHLTVSRNLEFGRRRRKANSISLDKIIECLELKDLLTRFPSTLSGGQRQRVALGRAIAAEPELLLLDEPLTAVEKDFQDRIADFVIRTTEEFGIPTILASHNQTLVNRIAKQIVKVESGQLSE